VEKKNSENQIRQNEKKRREEKQVERLQAYENWRKEILKQ